MYWLLYLGVVENHSLDVLKDILLGLHIEYDGLDVLGSERWGIGDMAQWCESNEVEAQIFYPTYGRQRTIFAELYLAYQNGRIKVPPLGVRGYKLDDILDEEVGVFDHNPEATHGKFGSPQKTERWGIQDDCVFALGAAIYAGLPLGVERFRKRGRVANYGFFYAGDAGVGVY
jgi:hypothetical protein